MRVYIAVAGVIVFLLGLSYYTLHAFRDTADQMGHEIKNLESDISGGDWDGAANTVKLMQQDWDQHKQWWAVFIDHQEIDNIDTALARATIYIKAREKALAGGELAVLKLMLEHIPEKERINLKNIF